MSPKQRIVLSVFNMATLWNKTKKHNFSVFTAQLHMSSVKVRAEHVLTKRKRNYSSYTLTVTQYLKGYYVLKRHMFGRTCSFFGALDLPTIQNQRSLHQAIYIHCAQNISTTSTPLHLCNIMHRCMPNPLRSSTQYTREGIQHDSNIIPIGLDRNAGLSLPTLLLLAQ